MDIYVYVPSMSISSEILYLSESIEQVQLKSKEKVCLYMKVDKRFIPMFQNVVTFFAYRKNCYRY